jgi:DNA-binding NtrC family response regulator
LSPVHLESFPRPDDAAEEDPGTHERRMIRAALAEHGGSITEAAGAIGWSRQKLYRRMKALSL